MDAETLQKYKMARDEAWPLIDKICSITQMVNTAYKAPNAKEEFDFDAAGLLNEMLIEEAQKIEQIFNRYLGNPYKVEQRDET